MLKLLKKWFRRDRRHYDILDDPLSRALREIYLPEEWTR